MSFKPVTDKTRWEGVIVSGWLLLIDLLLVIWTLGRPTDSLRFLLILLILLTVPLFIHFLYRTWGAFTLEYWLDRNAVTIRWANVRQVIPLHEIQQIGQGSELVVEEQSWRFWPAPYVRPLKAISTPMTLFATQPLAQCLLLETSAMTFVISPEAEEDFLIALQERYRMGASQPATIEQLRTTTLERIVGPGQTGPILLGAGLLGVLLLFGILMIQFPDLPNPLPVRYTRDGLPDLVQDKDLLFRLPLIGLFAWIVNGLWGMLMAWRRQPIGAYLLWSGTIVVQAFLLMALRSVLP
ncbi:MAG: hypothetical protein KDE31_10280 [Caldilineaceae bacterium]|nr:hypothetical protein [Caldilineaceae bacterium]